MGMTASAAAACDRAIIAVCRTNRAMASSMRPLAGLRRRERQPNRIPLSRANQDAKSRACGKAAELKVAT